MIALSNLGAPLPQAQLCSGRTHPVHRKRATRLLKPAMPRQPLHAHARHRERRSRVICTTRSSGNHSDDDGGDGDGSAGRPRRYFEGEASI
jgi:hypothetical protein